jgi:hypothetical protein
MVRMTTLGLLAALVSGTPPARADLPQSTVIKDVIINMGSLRQFADESDNFALTWHPNGSLYGAYGDGWGFGRTNISKRAIGVSRIQNWPGNLVGVDTWRGDAQGQTCCWAPWNGKSWGMIAVGPTLHMWFTIGRPRLMGFTEARIATSWDNGFTWNKADWAFSAGDGMLMPNFLQVGQGYSSSALPGDVMNYVYSYHTRLKQRGSNVQSPGQLDLVRVPKNQVRVRSAYQYFAGRNGSGAPIWTRKLADRRPVLTKAHLLDAPPSVAWNPYLGRFVMAMGHVPEGRTGARGLGIYEAGRPWGPWYKVKEQASFAQGTIFFFQLPPKWMKRDLTAWLGFTGPDREGGKEWDALNTVEVKFVRR